MTSSDEERKAAEKAQAVIRSLTPTTQRTDAIIFSLRYAASLATDANTKTVSSEVALRNIRIRRDSEAAEQAIEEHVRNIAAFPLAIPL